MELYFRKNDTFGFCIFRKELDPHMFVRRRVWKERLIEPLGLPVSPHAFESGNSPLASQSGISMLVNAWAVSHDCNFQDTFDNAYRKFALSILERI